MALPGALQCKERIGRICNKLPEVTQRPGGERGLHIAYMVKKRTFAYFTEDHHGDGRLALICKAPAGDQAALISAQSDQYFVPPYLGHRGWVGYWLDTAHVDWTEVLELITDAFRMTAPRQLVLLLGDS